MKLKSLITLLLFLFIGGSLVFLYTGSKKTNEESQVVNDAVDNKAISINQNAPVDTLNTETTANEIKKTNDDGIKESSGNTTNKKESPSVDYVYYFMTSSRCPSCVKIESYTKEAVNENFGNSLKNGSLKWEMIPVDQAGNEHFVKDYELYTKSVVLVKKRDGKQVEWKNLDKVWSLLGDKTAFKKYITDEITTFTGKS